MCAIKKKRKEKIVFSHDELMNCVVYAPQVMKKSNRIWIRHETEPSELFLHIWREHYTSATAKSI